MIAEIVTVVSAWEREQENASAPGETARDRMQALLARSGVQVVSKRVLLTEGGILERALAGALRLVDLVLILDATTEGGEKTLRKVLAQISGQGLVLMEGMLEELRSDYRNKGTALPADIETRALLPRHARYIMPAGPVRPGLWMEVQGKYVLVLPDEVGEAERMWERALDFWPRRFRERRFHTRTLTLRFVGRSPEKIRSILGGAAGGMRIHFRSEGCVCTAALSLEGRDLDRVERELETTRLRVLDELGGEFLGQGEESLEEVVGRLLIEQSVRIAVAESCTGGLITSLLVEVPGISSVLDRGVVTYSDASKRALLDVPDKVFKAHGAVSRVTARSMAEGVRSRAGTEIGLAVTGIAGPAGGSLNKPVGTVFIGLSTPKGNEVTEYHFQGDRKAVRLQSAQMALDRVRRYLLNV